MTRTFLAFDLGAESGRAVLGSLSGRTLAINEIHRFPNGGVRLPSGLYWDVLRLWHEIERGLDLALKQTKLDGIGVDAWGVDCALLGADGALLENPRHYRDARNRGVPEKVFEIVPRREIFAQTGVQFIQINTLYQLFAMKLAGSSALAAARTLLMIPDLFHYWLTGVARSELTIASTTQFYNPLQQRWAYKLLARVDLPAAILPEIVQPGAALGNLRGGPAVPVYATASHDTAAAVAAVPAQGEDWLYISSGTWSLMGVELERPVIDPESLEMNLTNEIGAGGRIRLLKNIAGLWLLQECRRAW
ncbi:MAG: rhamnulokinase, partial [Acidobacteria bacterium]|nr:rhamnulokinase [Acidobacteriota bacterium]